MSTAHAGRPRLSAAFVLHFAIGAVLAGLLAPAAHLAGGEARPLDRLEEYDVIWDSPGPDCLASMPLGNGDIGLNAWVEPGGDLVLLISKTDAWDENGRLVKVGRVRVRIEPSPLAAKVPFRQRLRLREGLIEIAAGGDDPGPGKPLRFPILSLRLRVDACRPAIILAAETESGPTALEVSLEPWRLRERPFTDKDGSHSESGLAASAFKPTVLPDVVVPPGPGKDRITWYHRNARSIHSFVLESQHLETLVGKHPDPLLDRTFGGCVWGSGLVAAGERALRSAAPSRTHTLSIAIFTARAPEAGDFLRKLDAVVEEAAAVRPLDDYRRHLEWWRAFWERSWIFVQENGAGLEPERAASNLLPLRIGADSNGQNRFRGRIGRVRIWSKALSDGRIAALAGQGRSELAGGVEGLLAEWDPGALAGGVVKETGRRGPDARAVGSVKSTDGAIILDGGGHLEAPHDPRLDLAGPFSIEAWIAPEALPEGGGRITDKCHAGTSDGWTFDTYPGNSLRLITPSETTRAAAALPPGRWIHVAARRDSAGSQSLFAGGKRLSGGEESGSPAQQDSPARAVTRGYILQRFISACAGRGGSPIKFNGSIFTVDHEGDPDFRMWGGCYWFQNTRLAYWPMAAAGDFDLQDPFFRMYLDALPLARDRVRVYYGHEGACFSETMHFWGTPSSGDFGWGHPGPETQNPYIRRYWQGGLELLAMLLERYDFTQDPEFLRSILLPLAGPMLEFFDLHWKRGPDGKILFDPGQSLETWHEAVDPLPEIAGLRFVLPRLLALPGDLLPEDRRTAWRRLLGEVPAVPLGEKGGRRTILPAVRFAACANSENPELYAVFPYALYGAGRPDLDLARATYEVRTNRHNMGWCQDSIQAACLGLGEEAARLVAARAARKHAGSRFPAFWGPNFDWVPDQDHGSNILTTLQRMLLQWDGRRILVLPAWPRGWDADFRLRAPLRTTVEGRVRGGRLVDLKIEPEERRKDVEVPGAAGADGFRIRARGSD